MAIGTAGCYPTVRGRHQGKTTTVVRPGSHRRADLGRHARTVQTDVSRVLWAEEIPQNVRVSGHVYDIGTGLVTTIVDAKARK
jgi:carbonic anhydrase